ncbi:hypothetical protein HJC23_010706 [Cyclotella cryptica]|uniref:Transcription factor CBF/NF-Y/archaeal histone domain-containing protein n=1 Tax=Cyclotella cryptica TaxID=29204 RepID=A0ABD3PE38_9STRA
MTSEQIDPYPPASPPTDQPPTQSQKATTKTDTTEFEPPQACIRRLLKNALPPSTNLSKDSCAAITRACGIFVLYLTSCANDLAREGRRTTVSAKDVMDALKELDFEEFTPPMEKFLEQHRISEKTKKEEKERLKATKPDAGHAKKGDEVDASLPVSNVEEEVIKEDESAVGELEASRKHPAKDDEDITAAPSKKQKVEESHD